MTVWILLAIFTYDKGPTSQQIEFKYEHQCWSASTQLREEFTKIPGWTYGRYFGTCLKVEK